MTSKVVWKGHEPETILVVFCLLLIRGKFRLLGVLLRLHTSLTFIITELALALVRLIGSEILLFRRTGILTNLFVNSLVQFLQTITGNVVFQKGLEMSLVLGIVFLLQVLHVLGDVSTKDAFTVHVGVVRLCVTVISGESLFRMRNVQTTIGRPLQSTENTATRTGSPATDIQKAAKGFLVIIDFINVVLFVVVLGADNLSIDFGVSLVHIIESEFLQDTTRHQKARAVGGGVVFQTNGKTVAGEFAGRGLGEDAVPVNERIDDLADDLLVGESNDQTVLG